MTNELASLLTQVADELGDELEVRDKYSGRGMHGETTVAVVVPDRFTFNQLCLFLGVKLGQDGAAGLTHGDIKEQLGRVRFDQMGRSGIVVY